LKGTNREEERRRRCSEEDKRGCKEKGTTKKAVLGPARYSRYSKRNRKGKEPTRKKQFRKTKGRIHRKTGRPSHRVNEQERGSTGWLEKKIGTNKRKTKNEKTDSS